MSSAISNTVWPDLLLLKRKSLILLLLATIDSFHTRVCEIGTIENIFFPSLDLVGINVFNSWNKQQKTFHEFLWIFNEFCYSWWTILIFLHVVCPGNWGIEILHQLQFVQQESIFITFRQWINLWLWRLTSIRRQAEGRAGVFTEGIFPCTSYSFINLMVRLRVSDDLEVCTGL